MKKRFLRNIFLLSAFIIIVTATLVSSVIYRQFYEEMKTEVRQEAQRIRLEQELDLTTTSGRRVTHIAQDGEVLYDSEAQAQDMENHMEREEIKEAFANGEGEASRLSATLGIQTYYYAVRLEDGSVVRVAQSTQSSLSTLLGCVPYVVLIIILVFLAAIVIGRAQVKRIVEPINSMNLEEPLSNDIYEEFAPLLGRLQKQKEQLSAQMRELNSRREELASITSNMNEGLVVLNQKGVVLSLNNSARRIFACDNQDVLGSHYVTLNRSMPFKEAAEKALSGQRGDCINELDGRIYELFSAPIKDAAGETAGAVMLIMDVTEKAEAEQRRREFTANVSHELKTPLTCIMGYAELLKDGMAAGQDGVKFAAKLYNEAGRLLSLIEDIIKLSHIDEGQELLKERVELLKLAEEAVKALSEKAEEADVLLEIKGSEAEVTGSRPLLYELVYNLIDNAVKYNKKGGRVTVSVTDDGQGPVLRVEDTGIGIAPEYQDRIFERFYRVDKSRTRETGGTGLGLAIVKNAAARHGAEITLESVPGRGSAFSVHFKAGGQKL